MKLEIELNEDTGAVFLEFDAISDVDLPKQALLEIEFLNAEGETLSTSTHASMPGIYSSSRFRHFAYINCGITEPFRNAVRIPVPQEAQSLTLRGHHWKGAGTVEVIGQPRVSLLNPGSDSVFTPISGSTDPTGVSIDELVATYSVHGGTEYELDLDVDGPEGSQGLILPTFLDHDGQVLLPSGTCAVSQDFGEYFYARPTIHHPGPARITAPHNAATMKLKGRLWKGTSLTVTQRPVVRQSTDGSLSDIEVTEWVNAIPPDAKVAVVYTTAGAIGSGSLLLRSNRLALEYANAGWWVVFFPFSELKTGESELPAPHVLQLGRSRFRLAFDALIERRGSNNVLLCSTNTDARMVGSIDRLHDAGWRVVYEIRDDMEEFKRVGYAKWYDPALELRFAQRADALVAVSPRLASKIRAVSGRDVQLIPNAAPDALIDSTQDMRTLAAWSSRTGRRKVGYIGHLTESWFDWNLFLAAARRVSIDFEIIGHGMPSNIMLPANVTYLGAKPHEDCIPYAREWSAGLIPFKISPLTYGVDPNKIYEYVAMGIRTVTAPMGQVEKVPGAWVYSDLRSMIEGLEFVVTEAPTEQEMAAFRAFAESARWSQRAHQMLQVLEGR